MITSQDRSSLESTDFPIVTSPSHSCFPRVIEILPNGNAIVDTTGLGRVLLQPGGESIDELLPMEDAIAGAEFWNSMGGPGRRAEAVPYKK